MMVTRSGLFQMSNVVLLFLTCQTLSSFPTIRDNVCGPVCTQFSCGRVAFTRCRPGSSYLVSTGIIKGHKRMGTLWNYSSIRSQQGTQQRRSVRVAAAVGVAVTGVAVGAVAFDAGAGATLPKYTSMKNMYVETVISGYEKLYNGTATEFSLGWPQSKDHCTLGNGTMAQLKSAMKSAISGHHRFAAELGVETGKSCGTVIPISTYSKLVKSIVTAVKTHTSWSKYWGGVVLDEEGSWGFKNSVITNLNKRYGRILLVRLSVMFPLRSRPGFMTSGGGQRLWDKAKAIKFSDLGSNSPALHTICTSDREQDGANAS